MSKIFADRLKLFLINLIGCFVALVLKIRLINLLEEYYHSILIDNFLIAAVYASYLFCFSILNDNNNYADPGWGFLGFLLVADSFLTPKKLTAFYFSKNFNFTDKIYLFGALTILIIYSLRHVIIYFFSFSNFSRFEENFRYRNFRLNFLSKAKFWLFSYINFHIVPIINLTTAYHPIFDLIQNYSPSTTNFLIVFLGFLCAYFSIIFETIADEQLNLFTHNKELILKNNPGHNTRVIHFGLWKYSRHPNYLGEILYFLSLILINFGFIGEIKLVNLLGFILLFCIFVFYSVPAMEEHLLTKYREDYRKYQAEVRSKLIPLMY
jgi:steroid 5-alpha reductase family enzyme